MEFSSEFIPLKLDEVPALSDRMKSEHARFVQILAVNTDAGAVTFEVNAASSVNLCDDEDLF